MDDADTAHMIVLVVELVTRGTMATAILCPILFAAWFFKKHYVSRLRHHIPGYRRSTQVDAEDGPGQRVQSKKRSVQRKARCKKGSKSIEEDAAQTMALVSVALHDEESSEHAPPIPSSRPQEDARTIDAVDSERAGDAAQAEPARRKKQAPDKATSMRKPKVGVSPPVPNAKSKAKQSKSTRTTDVETAKNKKVTRISKV